MRIFKYHEMLNGWYVGKFAPTAYQTDKFEANYRIHFAGEKWPVHTHSESTEINLLISGKMTFQNQELSAGDIFVVAPWEISNPVFIEDCAIVCIRTPGINDKINLSSESIDVASSQSGIKLNSPLESRIRNHLQSGQESIAAEKFLSVISHLNGIQVRNALDIGSWHLKQSIEMLHIFPDCTVHAFEPAPENFEVCKKAFSMLTPDKRQQLRVWQLAVGAENKVIDFFVIDEAQGDSNPGAASKYRFKPGLNGTFFNKNWVQSKIQVTQVRLDDWQTKYRIEPVDLIWMDVQGGELDVLKGGEKLLRDVKIIFTEVGLKPYYEGQSLKPMIDAQLSKYGFVEIDGAFELNGFDLEGNTVYVRK